MLRLMRLQQPDAAAFLASGAADHLMQKLEGALRRTRIAVAEAEVAVDDADQIELGEMMALGDELRADHNIEASLRHIVQLTAQPLDRLNEIARQHQDARLGKQLVRLLLQPFDA